MADASCYLCLNSYFIYVNDEDLVEKVKKYLQIDIHAVPTFPTRICSYCIESIEQFHEYYERVRSIHLSKSDKVKSDASLPVPAKATELEEVEYFEEEKEESTNYEKSDPIYVPPASSRKKTCDKRYTRAKKVAKLENVRKEMEAFYKLVECPLCKEGNVLTGLKVMRQHFKNSHKEKPFIRCCGKDFPLIDAFRLRRHVRIHTQPETCKCDICGKVLSTPRHMRLHRELHIPMSERTIECEECGRKCSGNAELYRHVRSIHAPQESICDICGKEFRRRVTFRVHMKTVHGDGKVYVCDICAKIYKSAASLNHHVQTVHSNNYSPRTKQCPVCGKWMGAVYVSNHILRCHDNATPYSCPSCDKKFKLPGDVRSHLISHSEERPFVCSLCDSAFKTKASLKSHISQHTGGNPVKCPYCSKMISCYSNYLAHRRRMHSLEHEKETVQSKSQQQNQPVAFSAETIVAVIESA